MAIAPMTDEPIEVPRAVVELEAIDACASAVAVLRAPAATVPISRWCTRRRVNSGARSASAARASKSVACLWRSLMEASIALGP